MVNCVSVNHVVEYGERHEDTPKLKGAKRIRLADQWISCPLVHANPNMPEGSTNAPDMAGGVVIRV